MYLVQDLFDKHGKKLGLRPISRSDGLRVPIKHAEVLRPGLGLAGRLSKYSAKRILVFGNTEISYMKELSSALCMERLRVVGSPTEEP